MDYIKGATDYLGITQTEETAPLATAAPNAAGAVSANELLAKKELNDEILNKSDSVLTSTKPDVSSKSGINSEIRSMDKSEVLHPVSTLPNTTGKQELNRELLNADKNELLHHNDSEYDSELRKGEREYQSIPLQTGSGLSSQQRGIDLDSPSISSRPEFQRPPFTAREEVPLHTPQAAVLPPQMSSGGSFQQNLTQQNLTQQTVSTATTRASPVKLETIQKDVVVHEHIHPVQKEEIQPVIYREREQLDVKQVTQMMHETQIQPTIVQQRELPAEHRQAIVEKSAPIPQQYVAPSREVDQTLRTQVVHAPIVQETIKKTIVEEVQPVLQKDVYVPVVVQNTKPIYEKIVEAPHVVRQVTEVRELGTRNSGYVQESGYVQQSGYVQESAYVQPTQNSGYNSQQQYAVGQQQYGTISQQYSSISQQPTVLQTDMTATRRLSVGSADGYSVQNMNMNSLPTGQVLPAVQSARPAYAYLPANYTEKRPDFIGTGAQYALAANGASGPTDIQKGIYNPYSGHNSQMMTGNIPQAYPRQ